MKEIVEFVETPDYKYPIRSDFLRSLAVVPRIQNPDGGGLQYLEYSDQGEEQKNYYNIVEATPLFFC